MDPLPVVFHPDYLRYTFGPEHPFSPLRQEMLLDLFDALGYPLDVRRPAPASDNALRRVHTADYLHAVASASLLAWTPDARRYGLDTDDVPLFPGMDEAARAVVGGTLEAARLVADGETRRALQLGGGLHHAFPSRAAGFCVYNDLAVAIAALRERGLRVAYIDIDVHHGDGVQWFFYQARDVLTISMHESGAFLFPGTGMAGECGEGDATGSALNIPLDPHTSPDAALARFEAGVPNALAAFAPDLLLVQAGADAHRKDPLAHLAFTTHTFEALYRRLLTYAERYTEGRAVFTLGGGYDLDATVRCWAILIHLLQDRPLPDRLPDPWLARWRHACPSGLSPSLHDPA